MENCDLSFCELRCKEVVNVVDGRRLGRIIDMVFDSVNRRVKGLIVPECRRFFIFRAPRDIFVPWRCVRNIGEDVILVELMPDGRGELSRRPPVPPDACVLGEDGGEDYGESGGEYAEYNGGDNGGVYYYGKKNKDKGKGYGYDGRGGGKGIRPETGRAQSGKVDAARVTPPDCDKRCEKCMLFDCAFRWKHDGRNFHFKMC